MSKRPKSNSRNCLDNLEQFIKACMDKTRVRILFLMANAEELSVGHLVEVFQTNQPKISRHLAYLKRAGLVNDRKEGLWVYYRLAQPETPAISNLLNCIISCCSEAPEAFQDMKLLRQVREKTQPNQLFEVNRLKVKAEKSEEQNNEIRIELL